MLVDANLLLYAVDEESIHHSASRGWLNGVLNGEQRVGLPWLCLCAFVRIVTNPRASKRPLQPTDAWGFVEDWLACAVTWVPNPTDQHGTVLGRMIRRYDLRANMITDAQLAALAVEHGLTVYSVDTDFARFSEINWINPIA